jgi:hypothetical protein
MRRAIRALLGVVTVLAVSACIAEETPPTSPSAPPTAAASASGTPTVEPTGATPATTPTARASPTPTPEPPLSLDPPEAEDPRVVTASVASDIGDDGGSMTITVTSAAAERIDELVLRWPTELDDSLFLAPFTPSADRIRDGGPPLVQPWTKWVVGPGEQGEPDGTVSLGWGPLLPGATLTIDLDVDRRAGGSVAFDLQILARNDLLTLENGNPAELRVEVP